MRLPRTRPGRKRTRRGGRGSLGGAFVQDDQRESAKGRRTPGADTDAPGRMVPKPSPAAAGEGCSMRAARRQAGSRPSSTSALTRSGACGRTSGDEEGAGGTRPLLHGRARAQGRGTAGDSRPAADSHRRSERGARAVASWRTRFVPPLQYLVLLLSGRPISRREWRAVVLVGNGALPA
jgi:hypothetical protein